MNQTDGGRPPRVRVWPSGPAIASARPGGAETQAAIRQSQVCQAAASVVRERL